MGVVLPIGLGSRDAKTCLMRAQMEEIRSHSCIIVAADVGAKLMVEGILVAVITAMAHGANDTLFNDYLQYARVDRHSWYMFNQGLAGLRR